VARGGGKLAGRCGGAEEDEDEDEDEDEEGEVWAAAVRSSPPRW